MQYRNTKPMMATAIMMSALFILNVLNYFMPALGIFTAFIVIVPPAILGKKYGLRWGVLCVVGALLLQGILIGVTSILSSITMAILGMVYAVAYAKEWNPIKRFMAPSVIFPIILIIQLIIAIYVMGIDISGMWYNAVKNAEQMQTMFLEARGVKPEEIKAMLEIVKKQTEMFMYIMPMLVILAGILLSYINIRIIDLCFDRFRLSYKPFPKLSSWQMPRVAIYFLILSWILTYWGGTKEWIWFTIIGANLQIVVLVLLLIQGLAFTKYIFEVKNFPTGIYYAVVTVMMFIPILRYIIVGLGLMDMVGRYREKWGQRM